MDEKKAMEVIREAESELIRIDTKIAGIEETLEKTYGLKTMDEIDDFLDKKEEELDAMEKELAEKRKALEEGYSWD